MLSSSSSCCRPIISPVSNSNVVENKCPSVRRRVALIRHGACVVRASAVESSSNFAQRMERAWLVSQRTILDTNFEWQSNECVVSNQYSISLL
nr:uncharacterized protein LOC109171954 [Ipomoea trifida]